MILTKHTNIAVRVLLHLAIQPGRKVSIATIAQRYGISRNHLMKVSQNLARLGYIIGYRGRGGGIALARPARNINLGHLLQQVERSLRPADGMEAGVIAPRGRLFDQALEDARAAFIDSLSRLTLADLVDDHLGRSFGTAEVATTDHLTERQGFKSA